jgi:hypothetical protein
MDVDCERPGVGMVAACRVFEQHSSGGTDMSWNVIVEVVETDTWPFARGVDTVEAEHVSTLEDLIAYLTKLSALAPGRQLNGHVEVGFPIPRPAGRTKEVLLREVLKVLTEPLPRKRKARRRGDRGQRRPQPRSG